MSQVPPQPPQPPGAGAAPGFAYPSTNPLSPAPSTVESYRAGVHLSPDAQYWWDGAAWQRADQLPPPLVTRSPDGRYWWDGVVWRPALVTSPTTNGLAIASLVLGILWLYWVGSILAIIFGHVALHQIGERRQGGRGLAIAGLVLGYIGLAFLVLAIVVVIAVGVSHRTFVTP